jgi:hypothetical protein
MVSLAVAVFVSLAVAARGSPEVAGSTVADVFASIDSLRPAASGLLAGTGEAFRAGAAASTLSAVRSAAAFAGSAEAREGSEIHEGGSAFHEECESAVSEDCGCPSVAFATGITAPATGVASGRSTVVPAPCAVPAEAGSSLAFLLE